MVKVVPCDVPQAAVRDDDVRPWIEAHISENGIHVPAMHTRHKVEPDEIVLAKVLTHLSVVLAFVLPVKRVPSTAFEEMISEERQLTLEHKIHQS